MKEQWEDSIDELTRMRLPKPQPPSPPPQKSKLALYTTVGLVMGVGLGLLLFDSIAAGVVMGGCLGLGLGSYRDTRNRK